MSARGEPRLRRGLRPARPPARTVAVELLDLGLPGSSAVRRALEEARPDVAREARRVEFARFCRRHAAAYGPTELVVAAARWVGVSRATAWRWFTLTARER